METWYGRENWKELYTNTQAFNECENKLKMFEMHKDLMQREKKADTNRNDNFTDAMKLNYCKWKARR